MGFNERRDQVQFYGQIDRHIDRQKYRIKMDIQVERYIEYRQIYRKIDIQNIDGNLGRQTYRIQMQIQVERQIDCKETFRQIDIQNTDGHLDRQTYRIKVAIQIGRLTEIQKAYMGFLQRENQIYKHADRQKLTDKSNNRLNFFGIPSLKQIVMKLLWKLYSKGEPCLSRGSVGTNTRILSLLYVL